MIQPNFSWCNQILFDLIKDFGSFKIMVFLGSLQKFRMDIKVFFKRKIFWNSDYESNQIYFKSEIVIWIMSLLESFYRKL